ncbi:hypothetical protein SNE26_16835 [Mucilaginibacter sp. cycad4]|uniref:hypothetical protein n=1 Tax=Mucilaginibacter sp. cycad4 TaxID=3342096 RepID=UPI002AAB4593|nr:hypothetical protein [Mucilaginibacter gossypii]WPU97693.1 hypothetical protein SNE26_16835 [Mucilaginibacter gossypii]
MKLTKNKLIRLTKTGLNSLGYREIPDSTTGAQGLYIKTADVNLFLTVGLTISRYYDSMFTASYYLSKVTCWGAVWGDIPNNSYERVGSFLTKGERDMLLEERYRKEGVKDAWWDGEDDEAIKAFIKTIEITESRFLSQPGLCYDVMNSVEVNELAGLSKATIHSIETNHEDLSSFKFMPPKPIDNIPIEWFKAAEKTIIEKGAILNINTVKRLAADAYRQFIVVHL